MTARAYYNEIDPAAAHILRSLIVSGVIAPGEVDTRSIKDVQPDDLIGFTQCHFFAGGGLWSVAARIAGWPDDRSLWTGSCPCQPFSTAGRGGGTDDPRHLWPHFYRLIRARRPAVVMGEQVAGTPGYGWFDGVRADLAEESYASRAFDFPACSIDAPHQRNRLYWGARALAHGDGAGPAPVRRDIGEVGSLSASQRRSEDDATVFGRSNGEAFERLSVAGNVGDRDGQGWQERQRDDVRGPWRWEEGRAVSEPDRPLRTRNGSWWAGAEWIDCADGKTRRTKPGLPLLVDGLSGRVDLWRVGGNAILPEAAAEVIAAFIDVYGLPPLVTGTPITTSGKDQP